MNEKNLDNVKTPDFLWHDKHWDLKDVSSVKAVDNAVRKGLHQIKDNPGGIILDFGKKAINVANSIGCHQPDLSRCHNPAHFLVTDPCRSSLTDRRFVHKTSDGNGRS
ncbi:MAG: hypothetical protein J5829_10070, partial [Lachnospiraceae bacterium]|nr:hypothetical protein [Lachnospiraceae bacterium]